MAVETCPKKILRPIAIVGAIVVMGYQHFTNTQLLQQNSRMTKHISLLENVVVDVDAQIGRDARTDIVNALRDAIALDKDEVTIKIRSSPLEDRAYSI